MEQERTLETGIVPTPFFKCPFKRFGCNQSLKWDEISGHVELCYFNIIKFGEFVNICEMIGYPKCKFLINRGNSHLAMEHFCSVHGANMSKSSVFNLELRGVCERGLRDDRVKYYTNTIFKSEKSKFFIMLVPVKKGEHLALFSFLFPLATAEDLEVSRYSVTYSLKSDRAEGAQPLEIRGIAPTINYKNVVNLTLNPFPCHQSIRLLKDFVKNPDGGEIMLLAKVKYGKKIKARDGNQTFSCVTRIPTRSCNIEIAEDLHKRKLYRSMTNAIQTDNPDEYSTLYRRFKIVFEDDDELLAYLDFTALAQACNFGSTVTVKTVLDLGVDPNIQSEMGETPLHFALLNSNKAVGLEKLMILLERNADALSFTRIKSSSLHYAVTSNNANAVEKLIQIGCDLNVVNKYGLTALGFCIHLMPYLNKKEDSLEVAYLLISAGAKKVPYSLVSKTFNLDRYIELHPELKVPVENDFTFRG